MPTPFYHINTANELLRHEALAADVKKRLVKYRCAFFLGNTAPDVQVVSGDDRQVTHFFSLPFQMGAQPAWEVFLASYPSLATPNSMPPAQAAFLAGYLCHLQADWLWIGQIFAPVFGPTCSWGTFQERLYLHNVLRSYIDSQILSALPADAGACLANVSSNRWLPFVEDKHIEEWRDYLSRQLQPGALARTVEVFAQRQGISPENFNRLLESEEQMDNEVFAHLPRSRIHEFTQMLLVENARLINAYFENSD